MARLTRRQPERPIGDKDSRWNLKKSRPMTRLLKNKAIERLQRALDRIPELQQLRRNSPEFQRWHRDTEVAISNTFGTRPAICKTLRQSNTLQGWSWGYARTILPKGLCEWSGVGSVGPYIND